MERIVPRLIVYLCLFIQLTFSCTESYGQQLSAGFNLGKTAGKLPMLAYGLGADRLGGAKSGYIDTGVLVKIVDSTADMYQLQLSKYHNAYIEKQFIKMDTALQLRPFYLTNSWRVNGDDAFDYVSIALDERMPYKSWMEINPSKIQIEIYGVQSNTNWITQLKSAREIKDVYFNQAENDVVRITVELRHAQHWGYSLHYKANNLVLTLRRQPGALTLRKMTIAVDAGHGGSNTGATGSQSNTFEKDYTIRFAEELKKQLNRKGAQVLMTRTSDTNIINSDRVLFLQQQMPDLLISLHLNSSANKNVRGVSTYYKHIGFRPLTASILDRMLQLNLNEFGNIGSFNFALNAPTEFPSSLVEVAFISNIDDEKLILDPRFQRAVAKKIYRGIKDWIKSVDH